MNLSAIQREFLELDLFLVDEPRLMSRSRIDDGPLEQLAENIRAVGLLQPLIVGRTGDRYEVVAGHRRRLACTLAGLTKAPCIVYPSCAVALEAIKYAENRHRQDLRPTEEAIWFLELLERDCGGDTDVLAAHLNEKRAYVERRIALVQGDPEVFRAADEGRVVLGVAEQLNRCTDLFHRRYLLDLAIRNGATVAVASGWLEDWKLLHAPAARHLVNGQAPDPPAPVPLTDAFTCHLCQLKEHPASMRPIQMHDYCVHAVLRPALALWTARADYVARPRTLDEAIELVNDLCERFPQLLETDERRI